MSSFSFAGSNPAIAGMSGFSGIGCDTSARIAPSARTRKQNGGGCSCMLRKQRKRQQGGARRRTARVHRGPKSAKTRRLSAIRKIAGSKGGRARTFRKMLVRVLRKHKKLAKTTKRTVSTIRRQRGGRVFVETLPSEDLIKMPIYAASRNCPSRQRGGAADISAIGAVIAGTSLPPSPMMLQQPTAGYSFSLTGAEKLADLKLPYAPVTPIPARTRARKINT